MTADIIKKRLRLINTVGIAVVVVALGATVGFGLYPMYKNVNNYTKETEKLRVDLSQLDGLFKTLTQVENEIISTEERLAQAEARLPNSDAMDQFMAELAQIADEAGMQVDSISPKPVQQGGRYRILPVEIAGVGTYEGCYKFLTGLRKMKRLTRLDDLVLELQPEAPDAPRFGASVANANQAPAVPLCKVSVGISTFMTR